MYERKLTRERRLEEEKERKTVEQLAKFVFLSKHKRCLAIQLVGTDVLSSVMYNGKKYDISTRLTLKDVHQFILDPSKVVV